MVTPYDVILVLKGQNHLVQHSKQHHRKNVLLSCLNYHILGFHPQTFRVKTAA